MFNRSKTYLAALLLTCSTTFLGHADPAVVNQPYTVGDFNTWESYSYPDGEGGRTYENFSLGTSTSITAVQWYGEYIDTANAGANPSTPNTEAFEISFWSDSNGQPGSRLAVQSIPFADTAPTSRGTLGFAFGPNQPAFQIPFYSYRAALPTPFVATAGQKYWISISSKATSFQPTWSWYSGTGGDGRTVQDFGGGRSVRDLDRSLVLEGVPATLTLPTASVAATVKTARLGSGTPAVFTLTLSAAPSSKVNVKYALAGNAVNGQDYALLNGKAKFKPGQTTATVTVQPQGDLGGDAKRKVKLTITPGSAYTLSGKAVASAKIVNP